MAKYIKANPKVAEHIGVTKLRGVLPDGNYLLWQSDMLNFGPLTQMAESAAMIGAIILAPHEAKEEQMGTVCRPLPEATDERFFVPSPAIEEPQPEPEPEEEPEEPEKNDEESEEAPVIPETPAEEEP